MPVNLEEVNNFDPNMSVLSPSIKENLQNDLPSSAGGNDLNYISTFFGGAERPPVIMEERPGSFVGSLMPPPFTPGY